jgi:hypothetical protein
MSQKITLTKLELGNLVTFHLSHACQNEGDTVIEFEFTSGIGRTTHARCGCGFRRDITDYSVW